MKWGDDDPGSNDWMFGPWFWVIFFIACIPCILYVIGEVIGGK